MEPGVHPPTFCLPVASGEQLTPRGQLACQTLASGYSIKFYVTRSRDGSYRVSDVVAQDCDLRTGSSGQVEFFCITEIH
jgi:hypothetical protein